jgi:uncharacterized membrane protein YoaK (UPF0700 family)
MEVGLRNVVTAKIILSWVAGYPNTSGFLRLNGLFTAHITGNLIVAGAEIAAVSQKLVGGKVGKPRCT